MRKNRIVFMINLFLITFSANCYLLIKENTGIIVLCILAALIANIIPSFTVPNKMSFKLRMCWHGTSALRVFQGSLVFSIIYHILFFATIISNGFKVLLGSVLLCVFIEAVLFWNGIISLYLTSDQLGVKQRVIGICCGMIPVLNLIVLNNMLKITSAEVEYELKREERDSKRQNDQICQTKYPIVMVHGVFFRDFEYFNYWGRIPAALKKNGADIYYGNHHSAASVTECAEELSVRIKQIINETACGKVNVIAHSKGGLDMRYAIEYLGLKPYIASLITVNTPHRGCKFADYLLELAPETLRNNVANTYNNAFKKLGDENPDFIKAVTDLTSAKCIERDNAIPNPEGIFTYSIGSKLAKATSGKFPLNITYPLVSLFDGANDGLVGEESFKYGDKYTFITPAGNRGISHADMIDLNRENLPDFDVREFYVRLVADLKNMGL